MQRGGGLAESRRHWRTNHPDVSAGPTDDFAGEGIVAEIVDAVEGGAIPVDGEPGVAVAVPAVDADRARTILGANAS